MSETQPQKVMIVDDDRVNRTVLAEILREDCRVILAADGASAVRRAAAEPDVDLILLDVSMPDMNGYEVLRQLRADQRTAGIAVVFVTALNEEEDEEHGLLLGAVDYLFKPVRPPIVRARIRNHLRLVSQRKDLERLAGRDGLTGIANRRCFDEALELACRLACRTGEPLGLAMIDVDYFKQYNDRYGHGAGDESLRRIARLVAGFARRPYDVAARYGGEEFVLLLPGVPDLGGLLEKLRRDVLALELPHEGSQAAPVMSVSIGAVVAGIAESADPAALLRAADRLLYQAKHRGRNCVVWAPMTAAGDPHEHSPAGTPSSGMLPASQGS